MFTLTETLVSLPCRRSPGAPPARAGRWGFGLVEASQWSAVHDLFAGLQRVRSALEGLPRPGSHARLVTRCYRGMRSSNWLAPLHRQLTPDPYGYVQHSPCATSTVHLSEAWLQVPSVTSTTDTVEQMVRRNNGRHEGGYRCVGRRCDPCARPSAVSGQEPPDRSEVSCSASAASGRFFRRLLSGDCSRRFL